MLDSISGAISISRAEPGASRRLGLVLESFSYRGAKQESGSSPRSDA
jgi:hypothetical protein